MESPSTTVLLVCGYALGLLVVAWAFDRFGARSALRSARWRTGDFTYHDQQDAWTCPRGEWLRPAWVDTQERVVHYLGQPEVCAACPRKPECSPSPGPREVLRPIDPWPHSEAGRFHRGIAVSVVAVAAFLCVCTAFVARSLADIVTLAATAATVLVAGIPLVRHLWQTPANFPPGLPFDSAD